MKIPTEKIQKLKEWFKKKKELIIRFYNNKENCLPLCYKGDIYFASLGTNIGREIDKTRPVVVFQKKRSLFKNFKSCFCYTNDKWTLIKKIFSPNIEK